MADPHASGDTSYQRGSQEISEQVSTFHLVMGLTKWGSLAIAAVLLLLTIWFMPNGNLFGGLIAAGALVAIGVFALRDKPAH
ncbi:aa3-type cytochrome c oxidase subunit IV [Brevundimonas sp.]|uniref:aa3-type cytochrome c oxidase subunit IV n=1 Tax=Brevundimonas sp. TaxID=1871086 RepID=UPI002E1097AC|nr:aa3-type cytochrome c oxidase subunit IV [Brevundimonas sp.]